jgi:superoxide dismutase, Cu-Zn family
MRHSAIVVVLAALAASACHKGARVPETLQAEVRAATGSPMGVLSFSTSTGGLHITGTLTGLAPGAHGIHLHRVGRCEGPGFDTAGAHVNPNNMQHGLENPAGPHVGDLNNVTANASGVAQVDLINSRTALSELRDTDGTAIVVHAALDDQRTDPSGGSGPRIGCGVVK